MIILVISMHAADTYSPLGNWYFVDRSPLSRPALLVFAAWQMYLQSFFMGLLFFVAGFFAPSSLNRKGARQFVWDRAIRLGLPVLFYMFVLGPVTEYFVAHSWTSTGPTSFANEWIKHIRNGEFLQENGPLWFCLALLIFSVIFAAIRPRRTETRPPGNRTLIGFALAIAAVTFVVRAARPPALLNMHLGDFPQYVLLFSAGIFAARGRWMEKLSFAGGMTWLVAALTAGFGAWLAIVIGGGVFDGNRQAYSGWHWQSASFDLWESFTCVAISFGLLVLFREKFARQGRFSKFLSTNAFSVYVFHPPIVILGARMLHSVPWHPLVKFVALTCIGVAASFGLSAAIFRRIPLLRAIL
jgi:surface polysaccharide O-acyltransferase-like enzyme